jgi:hypothetical protein
VSGKPGSDADEQAGGLPDSVEFSGIFQDLGDALGHGSLVGAFIAAALTSFFPFCSWRLNPTRIDPMYLIQNRLLFELPLT